MPHACPICTLEGPIRVEDGLAYYRCGAAKPIEKVLADKKRGAILPLINTCKTRIVPKPKLCACGCKKWVKSKKTNALYATKRCQDRVCQKNYRKRHREQENERNRKYMQKRRAVERDSLQEACKEMLVGTV